MLTSQVDEFDENDAQEYSQDNGTGKFITSSSNPNILKVIPNEGEPYYHNTVNDLTSYNYEDVLFNESVEGGFVNPFDLYDNEDDNEDDVEIGGKRKRKRKTMKKKRKTMKKKRNTRKKMNKKRKTKNKPKKALKRATRKGRRKH